MINLYGLRYFLDTCRLNSMTEAARLNRVSRPAISQAIKKLESDLEVSLLVHQRRGLEITPEGRVLYLRAERIFAELEQTESLLRSKAGQLQGVLTIGSAQAIASFFLQDVLARIREDFPQLQVKVRVYTSQGLIRKLSNREIDLAFFIGDENLPDCKQFVVDEGHFKLVRRKELKKKDTSYALSDSRPETERARVLYERNFSRPLPVYAEIASWDAIWTWILEGHCGGLIPDFLFKRNKLAARSLEVVIDKVWSYEVKALVPMTRLEDPMIEAFIQALKTAKKIK